MVLECWISFVYMKRLNAFFLTFFFFFFFFFFIFFFFFFSFFFFLPGVWNSLMVHKLLKSYSMKLTGAVFPMNMHRFLPLSIDKTEHITSDIYECFHSMAPCSGQ